MEIYHSRGPCGITNIITYQVLVADHLDTFSGSKVCCFTLLYNFRNFQSQLKYHHHPSARFSLNMSERLNIHPASSAKRSQPW